MCQPKFRNFYVRSPIWIKKTMENNVISCLMKDRGIAKEIHWKNEITLLSFFAGVIQFFFIPNPNFMLFNYTKSKRKPLFVTSTALKWNSLSRKQYTYYFPCPLGTRVKFILKSADIQSCALLIHKIYVLLAPTQFFILKWCLPLLH